LKKQPAIIETWKRRFPRRVWFVWLLFLLVGCATTQVPPSTRHTSLSPRNPADYQLEYPDVLEVIIQGQPDDSGPCPVTPEGEIVVGNQSIHIEGSTLDEIPQKISESLGFPINEIRCRLAQANSRLVYLRGPIHGQSKEVPYIGPEWASSLLQRAGGLSAEADPKMVLLIRHNIAVGRPTETHRINLQAIQQGDRSSDLYVEANDEIRIFESRHSLMMRSFPDWFRVLTEKGYANNHEAKHAVKPTTAVPALVSTH
jgi:protein involved in polysaccharide export with SLBB domain